MSGPLEHAGVEDVLSSIRRLVSEDTRSARPSVTTRPDVLRPRLVLTPALRVTPSTVEKAVEPAQVDDANAVETAPQVDVTSLNASQPAPETSSDTAEAPVQIPSPDGGNAPFALNFLRDVADQSRDVPQVDSDPELASKNGATNPPWITPETTLFGAAQHLEADQSEAQGTSSEDLDQSDGEQVEKPVEIAQLHNATARQRAAAVVRKIAEMEAATGLDVMPDLTEPDARQTGPFASDPLPNSSIEPTVVEHLDAEEVHTVPEDDDTADILSAEVIEATAEEISDDISETAFADFDDLDDAALLDEDALREMVVDIVRSELQGALGEKITRNVRKLVRREIHRALASHDLL